MLSLRLAIYAIQLLHLHKVRHQNTLQKIFSHSETNKNHYPRGEGETEGEGGLCREQDQLHPTPDTGLQGYSGTADGEPSSCLASRKACIPPPAHCFDSAKSSTLPGQVYSSGWHSRAIL